MAHYDNDGFFGGTIASPLPAPFPQGLTSGGQQIANAAGNLFARRVFGEVAGVAIPSGYIGEIIQNSTATKAQATTTNVAFNVISLPLTPGHWEVDGNAAFERPNGAAGISYASLGISTTSLTMPANGWEQATQEAAGTQIPQGDNTFHAPKRRIILTANTTIFLVGVHAFSTLSTAGFKNSQIRAVRVG